MLPYTQIVGSSLVIKHEEIDRMGAAAACRIHSPQAGKAEVLLNMRSLLMLKNLHTTSP
jgi:hypothetical protein